MKSGTRRGFAIAVAASLAFAVFGSFILGLFGSDFRPAYPALLILVLGQLVNAFWGFGSSVMMMMGRQGQLVSLMIGALVLNAVLNWLLIPQWGIVGAATATTASTIAWSGALFLYCLKALRLQVSVL